MKCQRCRAELTGEEQAAGNVVCEDCMKAEKPLEWDDFYTEIAQADGEPYRLESRREVQDWLDSLDSLRTMAAEVHGHEMAPDIGISRLWTIVDPGVEDDEGHAILYALSGFHWVNALYWVVSTEPVRPEHQDLEFLY